MTFGMEAALYRPAIIPLATPTATAFRLPLRAVARQYGNSTIVVTSATTATTATTLATTTTASLNSGCANFNGFQACRTEGVFGSCVASTSAGYCSCNSGLQYLDCVSAAFATSNCFGVVGDWNEYERYWIQSACPTPPPDVMEAIPQPTTVQLDLEPVSTVTLDGPITVPPTPVPTMTYTQGATPLSGECSSNSFSMIQGATMVYYVPFVGCNNDRPECCPFNVTTSPQSAVAGPVAQEEGGDQVAAVPGQFPMPKEGGFVTLSRCPQDFYSVSGMCCPNGYFQFTTEVASQTPCFSSLAAKATPPVITAGNPSNPKQSNLPTSGIVNVAWALGYSVSPSPTPSSSGMSTSAKIGIGVGVSLGIVALAILGAFFLVRWQKKRKARRQAVPQTPDPSAVGMTAYKPGYHAPPRGSPPLVSSLGTASPGPFGHNAAYAPTVNSAYTPTAPVGPYTDTSPPHGGGGWDQGPYGPPQQQPGYNDYSHQGGWQQQQMGQETQWPWQGQDQGGYQRY